MPLIKLIACFLLLNFVGIPKPIAGGWPQIKGGHYFKLSEWWVVSDQHFDREGEVRSNIAEYGYYSTNLYAEYGISHRLTGLLYVPFLNYTYNILPSSMQKQSIWKFGDADIGFKYAVLYEKPIVLSASVLLGLPTGFNDGGALMTGDGEFNQTVRLDVSNAFKILNSNAWLNAYAGYSHRSKEFAAEFLYGLESGFRFSNDKIYLVLRLDALNAIGDSGNAENVNPQSLFSNFREFVAFSPELSFSIGQDWGVTLGVGTALSGQNIFASPTFTVGVFYRKMEPLTD